jgi:hypothetical protein
MGRVKRRKRTLTREQEAEQNRRRYGHWQAVLAEGCWLQCGKCGQRQYQKGDVTKKRCRKCGAPLVEVGI